ncbi:MAG: hypothetical protein J6T26_01160 [Firmicutes bacterium]|nr:hypothetical protein [Bacillota bacterium]
MSFKATFHSSPHFTAVFHPPDPMRADFGAHIEVPVADWYDGEYTVTPSDQEQTIPIQGKTGRQNLTVRPIPSNYGLITRVGAILTVS